MCGPMGQPAGDAAAPVGNVLETNNLGYRYGGGATVATREFSAPKLVDVNLTFEPGCRVLVAGANGAGKSTLLSILGGQKMVPPDACKLFGKAVFHDGTLNELRMYCGDWWATDFFFNLSVAELIGEERLKSPRVQELIDIMQINISWRINAISDGQRRRCQLLECLAEEKKVYILDEITTDLDLFAREGLMEFLRRESEEKGASVFYATHIFDYLAHWATHVVFFEDAKVVKSCRMEELQEYHDLVASGKKCPLYSLMREWVFRTYDNKMPEQYHTDEAMLEPSAVPVLEANDLSYSYGGGNPQLKNVTFSFGRGARILVVGANGAGKSTLLSILGGKRMIRRNLAKVLGADCFNDPVDDLVVYMGDWWRTKFFMNLNVTQLLGEAVASTPRVVHLAEVLQINMNWKINEVSDGQRRRCQLLEILSKPRPVYLMDEITSDLDLYAREGILAFLKAECDVRGATIFYCTHIFDHLEGWATQLLHMSKGEVVRQCDMSEVAEYSEAIASGDPTPLYSVVRKWIYSEYSSDGDAKPWRKIDVSLDGRVPNLGLAGPFMMTSG